LTAILGITASFEKGTGTDGVSMTPLSRLFSEAVVEKAVT